MTSFPSASVLGRQSSRLPTGHMPRAPVLPCLQRSTLSAAPIRATTVKRAHESGPVATGAAELGRLFFWILPRSCLVLPPGGRVVMAWTSASVIPGR